MKTPLISIAMATYNGEQYIQEQLDSLAKQIFLPCELVVGDDGSTDSTVEILKAFMRDAPFPVRLTENSQNLGYSNNFLSIAERCTGDWIAFCDQDDVWLPYKLDECAKAIKQYPNAVQVLQNSELCNSTLERTGRVFPDKIKPGVYGSNSQFGFWVWPGCNQTILSDLIRKIDSKSRPKNYFQGYDYDVQSHDKWTCMISNSIGSVVVLEKITALFRRHECAQTGSYARQSLYDRVKKARQTPNEHYELLSEVGKSHTFYLERIAQDENCFEWKDKFLDSAKKFEHLSKIQKIRGDLYNSFTIRKRLKNFCLLLRQGGYFGDSFSALGWRSATKDLLLVFFPFLVKTRTKR